MHSRSLVQKHAFALLRPFTGALISLNDTDVFTLVGEINPVLYAIEMNVFGKDMVY